MVKPENWPSARLKEELDRIRDGIEAINPEEYAKGSRDFGRGFSLAMKLVMEVIVNEPPRESS